MLKKQFSTLMVLLSLSLFIQSSIAGDWTRWRGPNATGISSETNWNPKAIEGNPKILWETNVGDGHSSVIVKGDHIYAMGNKVTIIEKDTVFYDVVSCLDSNTGEEIWQYVYLSNNTGYPGPRTTPVVEGGSLYTLSWEGHLYCFDALTGQVNWMKELITDGLSEKDFWGLVGSPVIEGDLVILNAGSLGLALNKKTGDVVWKSEPTPPTYTTPVIFTVDNKKMAAIPVADTLYAVNIKTGKPEAAYPWYRGVDIDPLIFDNKILAVSGRGCRLIELNGSEHKVAMETSRARFTAWLNFVVVDNHLYGFVRNSLNCMDVMTGEIKWSQDVGQYGSISAADDKLIILSGDGNLIFSEANTTEYREIARAKIIRNRDNSGIDRPRQNHCWTQPVLSNGRIFARNNFGDMVCVDVSK